MVPSNTQSGSTSLMVKFSLMPQTQLLENAGTEEEKNFRDNVVTKLHDLVLPTTFHLQKS
jgi:hypothetical protein